MVTLTTDFGVGSPYVAAMKGVMLSINPDLRIDDLTHAVPPQNVRQGAVVLADAAPWFPAGTLHVAVVDPGVGTARRLVYAELGNQAFLAPDNGLLSLLALRAPPTRIRTLAEPEFWLAHVSATFHGRDILAPVAARLSLGLDPERLGPRLEQLVQLDWPEACKVPGKIEGSVRSVDSFGNLVTNVSAEQLKDVPAGESTRITCGDHETFGIFRAYEEQPPMTLIALVGSSGFLELAIVGDSAKIMLGEGVGAAVKISW